MCLAGAVCDAVIGGSNCWTLRSMRLVNAPGMTPKTIISASSGASTANSLQLRSRNVLRVVRLPVRVGVSMTVSLATPVAGPSITPWKKRSIYHAAGITTSVPSTPKT